MPERPERWRSDAAALGAIGLGSALGGLCRVLVAVLFVDGLGWPPPVATAWVNVSGAFLIGLLHVVTLPEGRLPAGIRLRQGLLAGFLGGYTTFSILSAETLALLAAGDRAAGGINMLGSLGLALVGVALGHGAGRRLNAGLSRAGGRPRT